jgi:hypothetical protein
MLFIQIVKVPKSDGTTTFSVMTLSITTFSIKTLSIKGLFATLSITAHSVSLC